MSNGNRRRGRPETTASDRRVSLPVRVPKHLLVRVAAIAARKGATVTEAVEHAMESWAVRHGSPEPDTGTATCINCGRSGTAPCADDLCDSCAAGFYAAAGEDIVTLPDVE